MTHAAGSPCPFGGEVPANHTGTCCSFDAAAVANNLETLGEKRVLEYLFDSVDETQAILVSHLLHVTAIVTERRCTVPERPATESSSGTVFTTATGASLPWTGPQFEEVITSIRQVADWYEKVSRLGFGVHPRY